MLGKKEIVVFGIIAEGVLAGIYFTWSYLKGVSFDIIPNFEELLYALALTVPLFLVNAILLIPKLSFPSLIEFRDTFVVPLAKSLDVPSALLISLAAGFGEELFFRGMLQTEFGILIASFLFSILHFGTAVKKYPLVALIYFLFGLYFGLIFEHFENLSVVFFCHAIYDFLLIVYLRYFFNSEIPEQAAK